MTPSSSGRKYVIESNADKTLDLGSGRLTWRLEPDIVSARNLVGALPERAAPEMPLISIQNVQFINQLFPQFENLEKRGTRQITCQTNNPVSHGMYFWERGREKDADWKMRVLENSAV